MLRWLCRTFPSLRGFFVGIGYIMLTIGGEIWFFCFPLTAYTIYTAHEFPLPYFGISTPDFAAIDYYLPPTMYGPVGGMCAAFTLYGLFTIYFNVRKLRRLRLGEN